MSFLFTNGNIYPAYSDTGPGDILVAPLATVSTNGTNLAALTLAAGAWDVTVNGKVASSTGHAINLSDIGTYVSQVKIGPAAEISGGTARSGINAAHATNINNSGTITGGTAGITEFGDGDFFIANTGAITGGRYGIHVSFSGTHLIFNNGKISGGDYAILGENGAEKVTNFGTLEGNVHLGDGDDIFYNFIREGTVTENGIVTGLIHLGRGDDIFNGGANREVVKDGDGKDVISFAGGNDHWFGYLAGGDDGADVINGGAGVDTYDASQSGAIGVAINLGEARSSFSGETAYALTTPGAAETIRNFENAHGTNGDDYLIGSKGANSLTGSAGDDILVGGKGDDRLKGGDDNDILTGGLQRDVLTGGAGKDFFDFNSIKDSVKGSNRDKITDFSRNQGDRIDLRDIDANTKKGGNQKFKFIGDDKFSGKPGELRFDKKIVQADVNGDGKADFEIHVNVNKLVSGDFVL